MKYIVIILLMFILSSCEVSREEAVDLHQEMNTKVKLLEQETSDLRDKLDKSNSKVEELAIELDLCRQTNNDYENELAELREHNIAFEKEKDVLLEQSEKVKNHFRRIQPFGEMSFGYLEAYVVDNDIYTLPDIESSVIFSDKLMCFVLCEITNDVGEEWLLVEEIYTNRSKPLQGYVNKEDSVLKIIDREFIVNEKVNIGGISIGDSVTDLSRFGYDNYNIKKDEFAWSVELEGTYFIIDPVNWVITGIFTSSEHLLNDEFKVGGNASEVIEYFSNLYPLFYDYRMFADEPDNWFELDDKGTLLVIDYGPSELTEESVINEFKLFNRFSME